jgi:hypothetical protein
VCAKASAVLGAAVADFFFHCWNLEILMSSVHTRVRSLLCAEFSIATF